MWEIFFFTGIIFLSLGFYELKKVKFSNAGLSPILEHKTNALREDNKPTVIPLKITVQPEVQKKDKNQNNISFVPLEDTQNIESDIEEKKRLWENHWIVKKVKERFENKGETAFVDDSSQQHPKNNNVQVFSSLLENVEYNDSAEDIEKKNIEQTPLHQEEPTSNLSSTIQEDASSDAGKDEKPEEKEKKEKEFDPFEVLGY